MHPVEHSSYFLCLCFWIHFYILISKIKYTDSISSQRQNVSVENITLQLQENSRRDGGNQKALQVHGLCITTWPALLILQVWDKHGTNTASKIFLSTLTKHAECMAIKFTLKCFKLHTNKYLHVHIYIVPNSMQYSLLLLPHKCHGKRSNFKYCRIIGSFLLSCQS